MQNYELLLILPGTLSEDEVGPLVESVSKTIEDAGGVNLSVEKLEKRRLAYPIKHIRYGYFNLAYFEAEPELVVAIQKKLLLIPELLRVLVQKHDPSIQKNRTIHFGLPMQNKDDLVTPRRNNDSRSAPAKFVPKKTVPAPAVVETAPEKENSEVKAVEEVKEEKVEEEKTEEKVESVSAPTVAEAVVDKETKQDKEVKEEKPAEEKVESTSAKATEDKSTEAKSEGGKEKVDMDDIDKKLDEILDIDLSNV